MQKGDGMKSIILALVALLCLVGVADAGPPRSGFSPPASYVGPGDTSAPHLSGWYGCSWAYSAAYAASLGNACDLKNGVTSATATMAVLSNGLANVATATALSGTDITASCTLSGTTATCTGASGVPAAANEQVQATGLTQPCVATANTISGGSGTITMSLPTGGSCGTIGSAITFTLLQPIFVTAVYDQTSTGHPVPQALTTGNQPQLFFNCNNYTSPAISCMDSRTATQILSSSSYTPASTAQGLVVVAGRMQGTATATMIKIGGVDQIRSGNGVSNTWQMVGGSGSIVVAAGHANDGVFHTGCGSINGTPAQSFFQVGTFNSGASSVTGSTTSGQPIQGAAGATNIVQEVFEFGFIDTAALSAADCNALQANEAARYAGVQ
jgi:hypothetical protein